LPSKIQESSGVSFSLSFLIQVIGAIVIAVWGYSQLDGRLSHVENSTRTHNENIARIEQTMDDNQDAPISSDHVQNTKLEALEWQVAQHLKRIEVLEQRLYDLAHGE
jgi:hypothetical protein|tara:strand:- start:823 stop:1143 length:321 start_codon:yes stop_codon:yes gene_type:complete